MVRWGSSLCLSYLLCILLLHTLCPKALTYIDHISGFLALWFQLGSANASPGKMWKGESRVKSSGLILLAPSLWGYLGLICPLMEVTVSLHVTLSYQDPVISLCPHSFRCMDVKSLLALGYVLVFIVSPQPAHTFLNNSFINFSLNYPKLSESSVLSWDSDCYCTRQHNSRRDRTVSSVQGREKGTKKASEKRQDLSPVLKEELEFPRCQECERHLD